MKKQALKKALRSQGTRLLEATKPEKPNGGLYGSGKSERKIKEKEKTMTVKKHQHFKHMFSSGVFKEYSICRIHKDTRGRMWETEEG